MTPKPRRSRDNLAQLHRQLRERSHAPEDLGGCATVDRDQSRWRDGIPAGSFLPPCRLLDGKERFLSPQRTREFAIEE